MTWGRVYWPVFLIVCSVAFIVPELIGLFTNRANTLSEYSWAELAASPKLPLHTVAWNLSLIGWLLAVIILTIHIWFKGV